MVRNFNVYKKKHFNSIRKEISEIYNFFNMYTRDKKDKKELAYVYIKTFITVTIHF